MAGTLPEIKKWIEANGGRKVSLEELKALTSDDRDDFKKMLEAEGIKID